jgi:putative transposase
MTKLRRFNPEGHPCFITNVTYKRKPLLVFHADLLTKSFSDIQLRTSFEILAWVIMPDHFHFIINLQDEDLSSVMQRIKMSFGSVLRKKLGQHSGRIWQNGFWDHIIRDDKDMERHMDYIHFNPVKHGYVDTPFKWPHSSIHTYVDNYPPDWGEIDFSILDGEYGE